MELPIHQLHLGLIQSGVSPDAFGGTERQALYKAQILTRLMARVSITQKQKLAFNLALTEGAVLSRRHALAVERMFVPLERTGGRTQLRSTEFRRKKPAPPRRFSAEEAFAIRSCYLAGGISYRQLARKYNCGLRCINQVVKGWGAYKED